MNIMPKLPCGGKDTSEKEKYKKTESGLSLDLGRLVGPLNHHRTLLLLIQSRWD